MEEADVEEMVKMRWMKSNQDRAMSARLLIHHDSSRILVVEI